MINKRIVISMQLASSEVDKPETESTIDITDIIMAYKLAGMYIADFVSKVHFSSVIPALFSSLLQKTPFWRGLVHRK